MSIGFNLTFGISGVSNFAYGALYILAAFVTWMLLYLVGLPYLVSALISILFTAFIGALMYRFILMRVRGQALSEVIATFGIGLAILEFFRYLGFVGVEYALPVFIDESFLIGDVYVDMQRILIVISSVILVLLLWLFVHYTSLGLAFRGIAQDERTALTVIVASLVVGFAQRFTDTYIGSHWTMIVSLVAILIVLVIKPSGLYGKQKELEERI